MRLLVVFVLLSACTPPETRQMPTGSPTSPPVGYFDFCKRNPGHEICR